MARAARRPAEEHHRGSGGQRRAPEPRYLTVGRVVGAHGIQGELKVQILTDDPHRFGRLTRVFVGPEDAEPQPRELVGYRIHAGRALLQIAGCRDRATAAGLLDHLIQVPLEEAIPLEEGEYFEHQIVGLSVWTVSGEHLGEIEEILYTGANEVYVVRGSTPAQGQLLIPAIADVVQEVDLDNGRLVVSLPPGLV